MSLVYHNETNMELLDASTYVSIIFLVFSLFGFIAQIVCIVVFVRIRGKSRLFDYLLAYSINNALVCWLVGVQFCFKAFLARVYWMNMFMAYVGVPALLICNLNSSFLDIITLVDRLSNFDHLAKRVINQMPPSFYCCVVTLISIIITFPISFFVELNQSVEPAIWYFKLGPKLYSTLGLSLLFIFLFVGIFLTMLAQIGFNIYLIVCIKKHLRGKFRRAAAVGQNASTCSRQTVLMYQSVDVRTTLMIIIMCGVSLLEHLLIIYAYFNLVVYQVQILHGPSQTVALVYLSLRRLLEIFFFWSFNQQFNRELARLIRLGRDEQEEIMYNLHRHTV